MDSVQVVRLRDSVPVYGAENVKGSSPRQIRIRGSDFRYVDAVVINGLETKEFFVESTSLLRVTVPEPARNDRIYSIAVLSSRITMTDQSVVLLDVGAKPRRVTGTLRLLQVFTRLLFRSPGSNIYYPESGGGVRKLLQGRTNDMKLLSGDLTVAVNRVQQFIVNAQSQARGIPLDERLLSASVRNLHQPDEVSLEVSIQITTHAGTTAAASFVAA